MQGSVEGTAVGEEGRSSKGILSAGETQNSGLRSRVKKGTSEPDSRQAPHQQGQQDLLAAAAVAADSPPLRITLCQVGAA